MKKEKIERKIAERDTRPPSLKEAKMRDPNFNGWQKLESDPEYQRLLQRIKARRQLGN
jgi:hypothetical protein